MIVTHDSSLGSLPDNIDSKQRVILDGIFYAFRMIDLAMNRLAAVLDDITNKNDDKNHMYFCFTAAYSDAWSIINSIHIIRELVPKFDLERKSDEIKDFLIRTEDASLLRNRINHLKGRSERLANKNQTTWGEIRWAMVDESRSITTHLISAGAVIEGTKNLENPLDKEVSTGVNLISLDAHGKTIYFNDYIDKTRVIAKKLEQMISKYSEDVSCSPSDTHFSLEIHSKGL